jgi:hypothetical protein
VKRPDSKKKYKISAELVALALKEKAGILSRVYDEQEKWNEAIKDVLCDLATQFGCRALRANREPRGSGFTLDVVWRQGKRIELGVESEWGDPSAFKRADVGAVVDAIEEDICKLLCVKAPLKLLVYTAKDAAMRRAIHSRIVRNVANFDQHVAGEYYLFVEFSPVDKFYCYKYSVRRAGKHSAQSFLEPLDEESRRAVSR